MEFSARRLSHDTLSRIIAMNVNFWRNVLFKAMPALVFLSAYYGCCGFISTLWKVDNKNHSIQFCMKTSIIFHTQPPTMLSVPLGWYVSQKQPTLCLLTTGFPNVDLQIVVIKLFLNTYGSKLGRGEKQITPCQQGFSVG